MGKKKNWNRRATATRSPGVFKRKEGGHLVRARVTCQATGRMVEIKRVLPMMDELTAYQWLCQERERVRAGDASVERPKTRFAEYAKSLFERKVKTKEINSAKGRRGGDILEHFIAGTDGSPKKGTSTDSVSSSRALQDPGGGLEGRIAELIVAGDYSPTTVNGWLFILRGHHQGREEGAPALSARDRREGLRQVRTPRYSEEEPNALLPRRSRCSSMPCASCTRSTTRWYPGNCNGSSSVTLRPLRRRGRRRTSCGTRTDCWFVVHRPSATRS